MCVWGTLSTLIQPGPNSRQLDQQPFRLIFSYAMVVMETSLKDLCSSCDTHASHALIDISLQLRYGIFSCVRKFLPFSRKRGNVSDFMLFVLAVEPFWLGFGWDPLHRADVCSLGTREQIPSFGSRSQRLGWLARFL